ncbi:MAG: hypothetical protein LKJ76_01900 [Lachnospiraceae bacterium]|jgi:hypothetical protein|nr:hypothetical protein [Lachnospiraceae bacterium]
MARFMLTSSAEHDLMKIRKDSPYIRDLLSDCLNRISADGAAPCPDPWFHCCYFVKRFIRVGNGLFLAEFPEHLAVYHLSGDGSSGTLLRFLTKKDSWSQTIDRLYSAKHPSLL